MDEKKEWAIIEIMGHKKLAGELRRGQFIEVRVPETPNNAAYVKQFGAGSIFAITPCSESVARRATEVMHASRARWAAQGSAVHDDGFIPVFDGDGLDLLADPMAEIDLERARSGELRQEFTARAAAAVAADPDDFSF